MARLVLFMLFEQFGQMRPYLTIIHILNNLFSFLGGGILAALDGIADRFERFIADFIAGRRSGGLRLRQDLFPCQLARRSGGGIRRGLILVFIFGLLFPEHEIHRFLF